MDDDIYEDHEEPIPEDATPEEIAEAAKHDMSVQSLRHVRAAIADRTANPVRGPAPVIKLDRTSRNMFAADKDRGTARRGRHPAAIEPSRTGRLVETPKPFSWPRTIMRRWWLRPRPRSSR
jgi:hypothetical protein